MSQAARSLHPNAAGQVSKAADSREGIKGKIRVPRLNGARVGVLSTRTPHRPCPIGMPMDQSHYPSQQNLPACAGSCLPLCCTIFLLYVRWSLYSHLGCKAGCLGANALEILQCPWSQ